MNPNIIPANLSAEPIMLFLLLAFENFRLMMEANIQAAINIIKKDITLDAASLIFLPKIPLYKPFGIVTERSNLESIILSR